MKLWSHRPPTIVILVVVLLALLPLLAVLQYTWLGQVSEAERDRMQASLRSAATQFERDFDGEITRAYIGLQMDPETLRSGDWGTYADRFDQWAATAPHPELVKTVYLLNRDPK